jgi:Tfp pilus assembly protein PilX
MFPKSLSYDYRAQRSSALVITLAAVVLISAIILVFFGQSTLHRQMSYTSAGQYRADLVAHTALDTIVGDLRNEIAAGSTYVIANGMTNYVPITNNTVVPALVNNQGFANLVKQSTSGQHFWPATNYYTTSGPIRSANGNSTATVSWNGRSISLNEWNRPGLLGDRGPATTPVMPATPSYTPPDWVIVTRQGPIANTLNNANPGPATTAGNLDDTRPGNMYYVIGRYAYTIYDEGGLLDVNVAGYPTATILQSDSFTTKRGVLPQVDLANIPGIDSDINANALVIWRNATSASNYKAYVLGNTNGFTTVAPGDQTFISRQDLIKYALANSGTVSSKALQYLGTFSRELNAPSYTPPTLGSATRPNAGGNSNSSNPSLINTPVATTFTRSSDGTAALVGEPLIKYRFPLNRLGWIGYNGPVPNTPARVQNIMDAFGLTYSNGVWTYSHGNPAGTIMSLSAVASLSQPREPDFFELLQAALFQGSLGTIATNSSVSPTGAASSDNNKYYQIMQIGANLIAQYSTNYYPIRISFNSAEFDGIENLPYLSRIFVTFYRQSGSQTIGAWYQPEIWNPHCQIAGSPSGAGPTSFQVVATLNAGGSASAMFTTSGTSPPSGGVSTASFVPSGISFTATTNTFTNPTILSPTPPSNVTITTSGNNSPGGFYGIFLGSAIAPDTLAPPTPPPTATPARYAYAWDIKNGVNFSLEYADPVNAGNWVPYSNMSNLTGSSETQDNATTPPNAFQTYWPRAYYLHVDPRTDRFGAVLGGTVGLTQNLSNPYTSSSNSTIRPTTATGDTQTGISSGSGWTIGSPLSLGLLSQNQNSLSTYYADPDGVIRPADGAYAGAIGNGGYPLATDSFNNSASRPVVLNRPFQSVAEMGYAFRGEPWKNIDFFTSSSTDAALLDLFCVDTPLYTSPTAASSAALPEAGRLELNTRQQTVLQAVLEGAIASEDGTSPTTSPINSAEAGSLASNLIALTNGTASGDMPLFNRSELVTRWISNASIANCIPAGTPADAVIKSRREAAVRALADVGNTRTWNLLIDVIAQSGRYGPTAATLDQFIVEGERRYWLHVAIDRYTNKVVAQYLEPVYE